MAKIDVTCVTAFDGWLCQVRVAERGSESRHSVTLTRGDFQRLTTSRGTPEQLVRRSFEFLLEREKQDAILRELATGYEVGADDADGLQVALRKHFPQVGVRPRGLSGERETWYVYRDGHRA